jgi:hypothetical protein
MIVSEFERVEGRMEETLEGGRGTPRAVERERERERESLSVIRCHVACLEVAGVILLF